MQNQSALLQTVGGIALALGSFLAWGTGSADGQVVSHSGLEYRDGWFTLIGGAVVAIYGFVTMQDNNSLPKWLPWAGLVAGFGVALINFFDILEDEFFDVGIGMWLMILGGIAALVGLLQARNA